ncbi:malectin domain-containing carbohydrate-binding protein [Flaviaesturariibacter aridisoli]|nr:malectin domain-containing carbohydrate-binding protein [Flaviaesturariibacter aridisoli]
MGISSLLCLLLLFCSSLSAEAQYSFSSSGLKLNGATVYNPTSIQFGPDNRLYIAEQAGFIRIYTVRRNGPNDYSVTGFETITLVNAIPNHDDDGTLNSGITHRQITGILLRGTAANPVIYVSSSDSRIGGPSGETNLDTNSGMVSMLTWNGTAWVKIDLVRGLPRSEENHSVNGMQLDDATNTLFLAVGGHTNAGSPSTNFNFTTEYALSAAILSVKLNTILALPTKGSGNTAYKYDLPTLDDPTRPNNPDGTDLNDPFGGNDGLNQAMLVAGGPVQIYSSGYRNPYDLVLTKARKLYTIDNGANQGWGGYPAGEGTANVTNDYVPGEPGSTSGTPTQALVNNLDNFHYIGQIDSYTPGSFYAGHPAPIRANPAGAGLYTHDGSTGIFRSSKTGPNPLPANWPPVPVSMADPRQGDFKMPGTEDGSPLTFSSSTNGITEYTASNFGGALKGALLAAEYNGSIALIKLTADGTGVTNAKNPTTKLDQEPPFASNFGATPLDLIAQGDNDIFPGTVWAITYGAHEVTIFEPQDIANCTGANNNTDEDGDGFTNADEIANGTSPCSGSSKPADNDGDHISDLNDPDDDNDGINDKLDAFAIDADNGRSTTLPVAYNLFNNDPGTGFFGLGFTGLMSNRDSVYTRLFDADNLIAGGAVGAFSVVDVPTGDALGSENKQQNGFQLGVQTNGLPFTLRSRMTGPFFNNQTPQGGQSQGIFLGNGDQDNYLKIVLNANGGVGGIQVVYENGGVVTSSQYAISGGIPASQLDLFLKFNPANNTVQAAYASGSGGAVTNVGAPIVVSGAVLSALKGTSVLAVGIISTSKGGPVFTATWDYIYLTADAVASAGNWQTITPASGTFTGREENAYVQAGDKFYLVGGRGNKPVQEYNPVTKAWVDKAYQPLELHHFQALTLDGLVYVVGAFTGSYPHETPVSNIYLFNPVSNKWLTGPVIPQARRRGAGGAVTYNGKVYLVGGITDGHWAGWVKWFDEYDPATNTWRTLPDAPHARDHVQVSVLNGKLYVAGGRRSSASTGQDFDFTVPEVDVYDFATGAWTTLPASSNLPTPRSGAANVVLGNELIVIGGESATQTAAHAGTEALDVTTNTWRTLDNLVEGRHGTQAIASNGGIFIATGAGNRGGTPILGTQEAFYFYAPTTPGGTTLTQSTLSAPTTLNFGTAPLNNPNTQTLVLTNGNGNQAIVVSSITVSGAGAFAYSAPSTLPFIIPAGKSVTINVTFKPTAAGSHTANLVVAHSGQGGTLTTVLNGTGSTIAYRINAGGDAVTNSIGTFSADQYFYPAPGSTLSVTNAISNTTDDAIYQSERYGREFDYNFPLANGPYKVVLHFAELYWTTAGSRIFDVSLEGVKKLDNYDIVAKTGSAFTATSESFVVTVNDGTLNIHFSALTEDGGKDNAKVSAIEILSSNIANEPPVSDAGPDKTITLPTNSVVLNGSGADAGGTIASYKWTQTGGPNTATFSSQTAAAPTVSGLVQGTYVFALVVTDNEGATSAADPVSVTVNAAAPPATSAIRINSGGPQLTTGIGSFSADQYYYSGTVAQTSAAIAGTTDDALYQTEHWGGSFAYNIPVSNGQYKVVLHFAEFTYTTVGRRIFDVSLEGVKKLDNYDIMAKVGAYTATTESFTVSVTDGTLNVAFSSLPADGGKNYAKVSAIEVLPVTSTNAAPVADAGADKAITLPTNSVLLNGSGTDADGTIATYNWSQVSGPNTASFSSRTVAAPTVSGLVQGTYVFALVVGDNGGAISTADQVRVTVNAAPTSGGSTYRINAGGGQLSAGIGTFSADNYYSDSPGGGTYSNSNAIAGTTDDALYQTERWGYNFGYAFPVPSGQYKVVLHFAEMYWTTAGSRVFDVSIEGAKKLDNYDIVAKVGTLTATTETFTVSVTDGLLNIDFSSLAVDGGVDNAKVSAIEILPVTSTNANRAPISNAGADQVITLPTSSTTLLGSAKDVDGTVASYRWAQVSGPNSATFSNANMHKPVVSGLVAGTYVFALTATDNLGATGAPDNMTVTVNPPAVTATGRGFDGQALTGAASPEAKKPGTISLTGAAAFSVKAYPNPSNGGRIFVQFPEPLQGTISWTLYSAAGERMAGAQQPLPYATTELPLDFSKYGLPQGVYYLEIVSGSRRKTIRILFSGR